MRDPNRTSALRGRDSFGVHVGVLLSVVLVWASCITAAEDSPFGDDRSFLAPMSQAARDRLDLLNLIGFYSHLADGLHTELFGEFFTDEAVFTIAPFEAGADSPEPIVWRTRAEIVAALRPRHEAFRQGRVQRRHFLTNPIVWQQTGESARVSAYLQLVSSTDGGPSSIVGTGRYQGLAVKTKRGWRMAEWTIYSDQRR